MRPSVEALTGDSNAAVTVVSTDAANENMSNQEMDMTESLFSERDMPRPRADVTYQSRRYRHITVFDVRKLIASDHRNQPQQPHNSVIVLFVGLNADSLVTAPRASLPMKCTPRMFSELFAVRTIRFDSIRAVRMVHRGMPS